jgi:CheY-like chemotaxis protein
MREAKTLLIVEDDPGVAMVLEELLEHEGYRTLRVGDAEAAIRAVAEDPPAAIVLDLTLPRMSGAELVAKLRELPGGHRPIVVITGQHGGLDQARALGARAAIRKPFRLEEVADALRRVMDGS